MRLSFAVLAFELGRRIPLESIKGYSERALSLPALYRKGMSLEGDGLYIARTTSLPKKVPPEFSGTIVCVGNAPSAWQNEAVGLIAVSQERKPEEVYNHIREVFSVFYEWDVRMKEIWEREGTLQELLDVSSPVFDNMLVLTDKDSNVLAGSYEGHHNISGKYVDIINSDMTPRNLASATRRHVSPTIHLTDLGEYMDQEQGVGFSILVKHINEPSSNIVVNLAVRPIKRPIGDHDCWMAEQLAFYIKKVFPRSTRIRDRIESDIFKSLLKGDKVEAEKIAHVYRACDFRQGDYLRCFLIEKPQFATEPALNYLRQRFSVLISNAIVTDVDNCFVMLLNDTRSGWDKARLREWISSWLGGRTDPIGISNRFEDLEDLSEYFLEAQAALGFAGRAPDKIMLFSDCRMDYVLARCIEELPLKRLFPPGLRQLLELNSSSSVDYITTLRIWLDEGMNDNQAAKKLHISRNSFLYRRDRIVEFLQLDLEDPEMRFYLSLCLRLLERSLPHWPSDGG